MTLDGLVGGIANAIAKKEGFYVRGSVAQRNANPGNLRNWKGVPVIDGYAAFKVEADGWRALKRQVTLNIGRKLTLYEFFAGQRDAAGEVIPGGYAGFSPAKDNNRPREYAEYVAREVGIDPTVPLNTISA